MKMINPQGLTSQIRDQCGWAAENDGMPRNIQSASVAMSLLTWAVAVAHWNAEKRGRKFKLLF
jgi:hypothetical protein